MKNKTKNIITFNASQTKKLGQKLAVHILKESPAKQAIIIGLEGNLGSGKTTFLQGFARGLGIKEKILSPTFVIMKRFAIKTNTFTPTPKFGVGASPIPNTFYHIDCYRLKKPKELLALGLKEIIFNPRNIVTIEWYENIKKDIPVRADIIEFIMKGLDKREIVLPVKYKMIQ